MINANITNYISTHIGNFNINIAFADDVTNFAVSDITFKAVSGNGITGVSFALSGTDADYMVAVTVPTNKGGAFSVDITGQVTVNGSSQAVVATVRTFRYDTIFDVAAGFGNLTYTDDGDITLPITYDEDVLWFDKSDLQFTQIAGAGLYDMEYVLIGDDDSYKAIFSGALNTWGAFLIDITGEVVKADDLVREIVNTDPKLISYNKLQPVIDDLGAPSKTADGYWNVSIDFAFPASGFSVDNLIIGVDYSVPVLYQGLTLDVKPSEPPPAYNAEYNFAGSQTIHCVGDWKYLADSSSTQARYFWLKFKSDAAEIPEIALRESPSVLDDITPVSVS